MTTYEVLNLGAGWQSTRILLAACRGELPKFDAAIFADTQWEPAAVYEHLAWLEGEANKAGIPVVRVTRGNLRADGIEFRAMRKSSDGKRFASIPLFTKNLDGKQGRIKRQCTKEYKIEPVELYIKRELLGLKPKQRMPKDVLVRQWFGISADESSRATFPGRYKEVKTTLEDLFGNPFTLEHYVWRPVPWRHHCYPLLNEVWTPDRQIVNTAFLPKQESREDVGRWLKKHYPERKVPRSACLGCPFRTNDEWREMRDERPAEWADACDFDDAQRQADAVGQANRKALIGLPYVHRQLVPLRMADLSGEGERVGGGCGTLFDGQDGLCGR